MPELLVNKLVRTTEELSQPEIAQINGKVPVWLRGTFLRTGPGKFDFDQNFVMSHLLDGYAILTSFSIGDNCTVKYEKKFVNSDAYKRACSAQKPMITEFGTKAYPDPNKSLFSRIISAVMPIELSDNTMASLFQMGSDLFATSETSFFRKVNPCTLFTGEKFDTNKCFGTNIAGAHPLTDEKTGIMYNFGSTVLTGLKYNIIKIPSPASNQSSKDIFKKSKILCSIPSSWTGLMSYTHSFAMTKSYVIFIEQPFVMNIALAAKTYLKGPCFKEWLEWRPELKNRFFIIEKETGKLLKTEFFSKDPFFFLHVINAYEENDQIVIDLTSYSNASVLDSLYISKIRQGDLSQETQGCAHRYVIPLVDPKNIPENVDLVEIKSTATAVRKGNTIIVTPEILTDKGLEMPTFNKKFLGQRYSYFYAAGNWSQTNFSNSICKVDLKKKETILWKENEYCFPGEAMFVPNPNANSEDDGVLISAVTDAREEYDDFVVFLDAKTLKELGRAKFKAHIPQALHGIFLSSYRFENKSVYPFI